MAPNAKQKEQEISDAMEVATTMGQMTGKVEAMEAEIVWLRAQHADLIKAIIELSKQNTDE